MNNDPLTIRQTLDNGKSILKNSGSALIDCEALLCFSLEKPRSYLYTWPDKLLTAHQQKIFSALLIKRSQGEPIAYLTQQKEFWSLQLTVTPDVLIPRPETELLVETCLRLLPNQPLSVLDLGTGSGAIALALGKEKSQWSITGIDNCSKAIQIAEKNCQYHDVNNVRFFQSHWFKKIDQKKFQLIASNPPYIEPNDMHLSQGDVRYEPRSALIAEECGLADIKHIIQEARQYLSPQGWLLLEHGYNQGNAIRDYLADLNYAQILTHKDLSGHERITQAQWLS